MITFQTVRWKNFLSTGNVWTEVDLNAHGTTLMIGENGAGKSTILDALSFGLYGKPFRKINKPQLMNSINGKGLLVEIEFMSNSKQYKIVRGMKPNIFQIWRNGELVNQDAAARDYQTYLETNILKMNFKSFGQIVVLGSSTFVPFMQLPPQHRREIIEDLLDIQIFSTMNTLLKEKVSTNKTDIMDADYKVHLVEDRVKSAKEHNESIKKMKQSEIDRINKTIETTEGRIVKERENLDKLTANIVELETMIADKDKVNSKFKEYGSIESTFLQKIKTYNQELAFYTKHDNCPTCKQGIDHDFKEHISKEKSKHITEISGALKEVQDRIAQCQSRRDIIQKIEAKITKEANKRSEANYNLRMFAEQIETFKTTLETAMQEVESISKERINALKNELKEANERRIQLTNEKELLNIVGTLLKDGGIKTRIIRQYVPVMNKLINSYLSHMEFFVDFQLDENFNESIKSRFRDDFSYASFSEGEKMKIDLSLMLTWRAISRIRNSTHTNLLIMDEIFDGSLDADGAGYLMEILKSIVEDSNVFVISHRADQLQDKFDNVIKFKKIKNFSVIEE